MTGKLPKKNQWKQEKKIRKKIGRSEKKDIMIMKYLISNHKLQNTKRYGKRRN